MQEKPIITMKWTVTPSDYLRGYEEALFYCLQAKVENGEIVLTRELDGVIDPKDEQRLTQIKVTNFLKVVCLKNKKKAFSLNSTGFVVDYGRNKAYYLIAESGSYVLSGTDIKIILTKKDQQSDDEPIVKELQELSDLYELFNEYGSDEISSKIYQSYKNALDHDEKLLVYLYEIRDTLSNYFGNDETAKQMLNISSRKWSKFGTLANDHSINQSRHYLEVTPNSREITEEERNSAFSFAQTMIESFLYYLKQYRNK